MSNKVVTGAQVGTEKDLAQQVKELQEQVAKLQKRSRWITPEIEELVELYNDLERYYDKCYSFVDKSCRRMKKYCGDDIDDVVLQNFNRRFGTTINEMEKCIEKDILGCLIDEVSIHSTNKEG